MVQKKTPKLAQELNSWAGNNLKSLKKKIFFLKPSAFYLKGYPKDAQNLLLNSYLSTAFQSPLSACLLLNHW